MRGMTFYTIVMGLTSGILFRSFFVASLPYILFLLLLSFSLALLWRLSARPGSVFFMLSLLLLTAAVGMVRLEQSEQRVSPLSVRVGETHLWQGVVAREPDERQSSTHLYIREAETDTLFLVITDPFVDVSYGDRVSVEGTLALPEPFETDTGRTFDYKGYLRARGVTEMISHGEVTVVTEYEGKDLMSTLFSLKQRMMYALERALPEPVSGLGEGILLGVKRALGDELTEIFRTAGIIHIVVLSGYNIMIVADSIMRCLGYLFFPRTRLILGVLVIVLFALMVGLSATVIRASIMVSLVLIARHIGRPYAGLRALCLTGVLMLFINPYLLIFDPGFQLSFLATLGLILVTPVLEERLTLVPRVWGVRGYLASTLGTQLYVLPLLIFSMGTLSFVSIAVNMLVLPIVPIAMLLTFVTGILGLFSETLGLVVGFGAYLVLTYVIKIAALSTALPFAAVMIPAFPLWVMGTMYAGIAVWTYFILRRESTIGGSDEELSGWTIVTEKETARGTVEVPRTVSQSLPFK